jgi:hypothetical protein
MSDCFEIGRALGGPLAGFQPIVDGTFDLASFSKVIGQQFWLRCGGLCEALLQDVRDAAVDLLALRPQEGLVSRVADQGVLEGVARLGRRATPEHQLGRAQPVEGGREGWLGLVSDRCE